MSFFKNLKAKFSSKVQTQIEVPTTFSMSAGRIPATATFTCTGDDPVQILSLEYRLTEVRDSHQQQKGSRDGSRRVVAEGSVHGPWDLQPGESVGVPFEVELASALTADIAAELPDVAGKLLKFAGNRGKRVSRYDLGVGPSISGHKGLRYTNKVMRNSDVGGWQFRIGT